MEDAQPQQHSSPKAMMQRQARAKWASSQFGIQTSEPTRTRTHACLGQKKLP